MDAFAALADPVRRALLVALAAGPARVADLAASHPISRPAVSRHLRVLAEAGLVAATDAGRERHYRLQRPGLAPVTDWLEALGPPDGGPRVTAAHLDALDLEVRRTTRDRRTTGADGADDRADDRAGETA
ncbi:metalloregulator ArsR/SmtB family transcription factor [uncultured Nocardioides sp.]|uniref:ArsR/SmtB family transcription factor n=1 Tax=uncultured Nocardioides sp. TaxID=198441 RepID=UPI002612617F|nr:metalloregulator ArsR/SmtB family transcription factor [uncultured Nocardioides sp.]